MDLQTNQTQQSNAKLYCKVGWKQEEVIELTSSLSPSEVIFSLSEYERLELRFESGKEIKAIKVESLQSDEEVVLQDGDSVCLTDGTTNQEVSIIPGIYGLYVINEKGDEFPLFFEITSHNMSSSQLERMKEALESRVLGITRDLFNQREASNQRDGSSNFVDTLSLLIKYYNKLEEALDKIIGEPIENLTKVYQTTTISKRPTPRSQRWNVTKGERYKVHNVQTAFCEPRVKLDLQTPENRFLKHNLMEILTAVSLVSRQYRFNESGLDAQINQLKTDIMSLRQQRNRMSGTYNLDKSRSQMDFEISTKSKELEQIQNQRRVHLENQRKLKGLNAKLVAVLNETWIKDIRLEGGVRLTQRAIKNPHYTYVYQICQKLLDNKKSKGETPTFPFIETSRLFEFYSFLLTIDLLEKQGFAWEKGWLKDYSDTKKIMYALTPGEELWFKNKEGYRVQLIYDKFLNNSNVAKMQKLPQVITATSSSLRPDILMNLYHHEEFLSSMIIEVKYRKLKHMYRKDVETNVMRQLMDYESLRYYNPNKVPLFRLGIVSKVAVIYPFQEGANDFVDENYGYQFISVEPTGFNAEVKGISVIENLIKEFFEENIGY